MTQYRYDGLQFSTELPNFVNTGKPSVTLTVSGTIADGNEQDFTATLALDPTATFNDFKLTSQTAGQATYLTNDNAVVPLWIFASSETIQNSLSIIGTTVTFSIQVSNFTGAPVTLRTQMFTLEAIEYALPI
jgi:hypothetical protein